MLLVVAIEHVMIVIKFAIEQLIEDTPHEMIREESMRRIILREFKKGSVDEIDKDEFFGIERPVSPIPSTLEATKLSLEAKIGGTIKKAKF